MDLIYADTTKKDIGVLNAYELDMAYGSDENNFECALERQDHCCEKGFFIYVEGEEYGGIVDSIRVDTSSDKVVYCGRTWHGILQKKVICPDPGKDYVLLDGEANEVLQEIIDHIGLSDLFEASDDNSGIEIDSYQMYRYCYAYEGICRMLRENAAKLKLAWHDGKVILSAEARYDYSQDEEFDTSQVEFTIQADYRAVNHMICLGQGELKDRAVIHLFTDEYGGVQPYATSEDPVEDSDYILTTANQVMTGRDEVTEVYDVPNAAITDNYVELDSQPSDWSKDCENYYLYEPNLETIDGETVDTGGRYKNVEKLDVGYLLQKKQPYDWAENFDDYYTYNANTDQYTKVSGTTAYNLLSSKPGNWSKKYESYFYKEGNTYKSVSGVKTTSYIKQKERPSDWKKNYANYYYLYSDGVTTEYRKETAITTHSYKRQTRIPSDWLTNYGNYYRPATATEIRMGDTLNAKSSRDLNAKVKRETFLRKVMHDFPVPTTYTFSYDGVKWSLHNVGEVTLSQYGITISGTPIDGDKIIVFEGKSSVQQWLKVTLTKKGAVPTWKPKKYYTKVSQNKTPAWNARAHYTKKEVTSAPAWAANTYYNKVGNAAPAWAANTYYTETDQKVAPEWMAGQYFEKFQDRYAAMVAEALEKLAEYHASDRLDINLMETDQVYDVGDLVGTTEQVTGIEATQEVIKKVIKIKNDDIVIRYEVG